MKVASDKAKFWCVWRGKHYMLANLSTHLKKGVKAGHNLLLDEMYREHLVPQSEVAICFNPPF